MEYKEILDSARTCIGPYCKACPVCNGKACGNQVPGLSLIHISEPTRP